MAVEDLEALRVPLTGYCYRLLGSAADTDDAVQETLIRASARRDQYDPSRGRLSTWVHGIATNVCIDMLRSAKRRALVVDLSQATGQGADSGAPLPSDVWLEPMPDSRLIAAQDPGEVVLARESIRLAFIAALQYLAPRQRDVLVLRDVLAFTAQATAQILGTTVPAVNSALQRARASLEAQLTSETQAERERLASLFSDLAPEQWHTPSLCAGWRVCEVVAHITMPFRTRPLGFMTGMVRAGFSFNRYADRDARATAHERSQAELVGLLRHNIDNPWRPPGGGQVGALSHDVIHGLDVTEPLGLPAPPADRIALVLASAGSRQLKYFGVDLEGHRLIATDADVSVGEGASAVPMTAKEILLVVAGRHPVS